MPNSRQSSEVALTLARETGWPPPELLVRVSMQRGTSSRDSSNSWRSRARGMFPPNGWRASAARPLEQLAEPRRVLVPLERMVRVRVPPLRNHQVEGDAMVDLDVGPGGV